MTAALSIGHSCSTESGAEQAATQAAEFRTGCMQLTVGCCEQQVTKNGTLQMIRATGKLVVKSRHRQQMTIPSTMRAVTEADETQKHSRLNAAAVGRHGQRGHHRDCEASRQAHASRVEPGHRRRPGTCAERCRSSGAADGHPSRPRIQRTSYFGASAMEGSTRVGATSLTAERTAAGATAGSNIA